MATEKDFIKDLEGLPLTRRNFLKGAAGAFIAASMGPSWREVLAQSVDAPPEEWDEVTDVVVVGTGFAGLAAAIEAHDAGADVLILEKAPEKYQGGNSRVSLQAVFNPEPKETAIIHFKATCTVIGPEYLDQPEDMIEAWAEEMGKSADWLKSIGVPGIIKVSGVGASFPELPGSECTGLCLSRMMGGGNMWDAVDKAVDERGIRALYETPAKKLIQDPDTREILGVVAERNGRETNIKARRAVMLGCGGFHSNHELQAKYCPFLNGPAYGIGTPYNEGDGIPMSLAVGADLWHMGSLIGPFWGPKLPGYEITNIFVPGGSEYIWVDGNGRRFVAEVGFFDVAAHCHGKKKSDGTYVYNPTPPRMHCIFDERLRERGPIFAGLGGTLKTGWFNCFPELLSWSSDNMAEVRKGWITQADSIRELARKINMDPSTLEDTVTRYNGYCGRRGKDLEFNRSSGSLRRIDRPPYYALPLVPMIIDTQGGPKRNARSQIVDASWEPIPRLYSAGALGSITSYLYFGGGAVGEAMAFGRIAGRNAAKEVPI